jgi:hypothetical protein
LVAEIKVAEFQRFLSDHPAVIDFSNLLVMGQLRIRIDFEALAQHYGLKTKLIDFTTNPFVAAFFACCECDPESDEYRPILGSKKEGVIYSYNDAAAIGDPDGPEEPYPSVVGLQPLRRSAEQYAWCYRLPESASLNRSNVSELQYNTRAKQDF